MPGRPQFACLVMIVWMTSDRKRSRTVLWYSSEWIWSVVRSSSEEGQRAYGGTIARRGVFGRPADMRKVGALGREGDEPTWPVERIGRGSFSESGCRKAVWGPYTVK